MQHNIQDQASGLRRLKNQSPPRIITVTGGKGGVGKTNITLNTAIALAQLGKNVMVLDADLSLANVDVLLGLHAKKNLAHVVAGVCELEEAILTGPYGIQIIPAASGIKAMSELSPEQHARLITSFQQLDNNIDFFFVDTAAGISDMVLSFSKAAEDVVVVVCNEPTSITDAYGLIKLLSTEYQVSSFKIVANMVRSYQDGRNLYDKLIRVTQHFLKVQLELVACVPFDEKVRQSVRGQRAVVDVFPDASSSAALIGLARKVISWSNRDMNTGAIKDHKGINYFMNQLTHPQKDVTRN